MRNFELSSMHTESNSCFYPAFTRNQQSNHLLASHPSPAASGPWPLRPPSSALLSTSPFCDVCSPASQQQPVQPVSACLFHPPALTASRQDVPSFCLAGPPALALSSSSHGPSPGPLPPGSILLVPAHQSVSGSGLAPTRALATALLCLLEDWSQFPTTHQGPGHTSPAPHSQPRPALQKDLHCFLLLR